MYCTCTFAVIGLKAKRCDRANYMHAFSRDSELHHLTDSLKKIYLHIYLDKKSQAHLLL